MKRTASAIVFGAGLAVVWLLPLFRMRTLLWQAVWACLILVLAGGGWVIYRSNVETERGLQKVSNILLGFVIVQMVIAAFIVFEAAKKR